MVVPVGGGGLASGDRHRAAPARAPRSSSSACRRARARPTWRALAGPGASRLELPRRGATIADGIALKRPGELTLPLLRELLDELVTVSEDEIADAMVFLAERAKLVAEGAGAVAVAALISGRLRAGRRRDRRDRLRRQRRRRPAGGGSCAAHETEEGRRVRMFTRVPDRPGGARRAAQPDRRRAREPASASSTCARRCPLHVRETGVELTLETRGPEHTAELLAALQRAGYEVSVE